MRRKSSAETFRNQMAQSMAELRSIMSLGRSPTGDGRLTARTIEVTEPPLYNARTIKHIRATLNVSQAVFAGLLGVSSVLIRSWERGARQPAPIARRLLHQIQKYPGQFATLVHPAAHLLPKRRVRKTASRANAA